MANQEKILAKLRDLPFLVPSVLDYSFQSGVSTDFLKAERHPKAESGRQLLSIGKIFCFRIQFLLTIFLLVLHWLLLKLDIAVTLIFKLLIFYDQVYDLSGAGSKLPSKFHCAK